MRDAFAANLTVNMRFFRRNRLLLAAAALLGLLGGVSILGGALWSSRTNHFETLRSITSTLDGYAVVWTALLGLFLISSQLRNKNLKLVFTRPCSPEVWLASAFSASILMSAILYAGIVLASFVLSIVWSIPYQGGLAVVVLHSYVTSILVLSYLALLASVVHPVLAVIIALVFNDNTFKGLSMLVEAVRSTGRHPILNAFGAVLQVLYLVLPDFSPFSDRLAGVESSLRATAGDWWHLLLSAGYAILVAAFCYLVADFAFRRKSYT
jgi:hypothetical protein